MSSELGGASPAPYKKRRGWLIAFGVVEILIAGFFVLLMGALLLLPGIVGSKAPVLSPASPLSQPAQMLAGAIFEGCIASVFLAVGIGSILCRNWARVAMLAISVFWLVTGVISTAFILVLTPSIMQQTQPGMLPGIARQAQVIMTTMLGVSMIIMPAVFLFFYSRKSVKATCFASGRREAAEIATSPEPAVNVPVPLVLLAVWYALGVLALSGWLWARATIVFGVVLHGRAAFLVLFAYSVLSAYAAWNIYHKRLVGWAVGLFISSFWLASGIATLAGHDVLQTYRQMGLNQQLMQMCYLFPRLVRSALAVGVAFGVALVVFTLYAKKYFAPSAAAPVSGDANLA